MWTFKQSNGAFSDKTGQTVVFGYSGFGEGKDNPADEKIIGVGPIPTGDYKILAPRDTDTHGPYVMPLEPCPGTETFGRSDFLIHGDKIGAPGTASHGCVILPRVNREQVWSSGDHLLEVIE